MQAETSTKWGFQVQDVPAVGNCLFESVGRTVGSTAAELRAAAVAWMRLPEQMLHGEQVANWILWNGNMSLEAYTENMAKDGVWGGGIELAVLSSLLQRPILVYERHDKSLKRIAEFLPDNMDPQPLPVICILYVGRSHYMQLTPFRKTT